MGTDRFAKTIVFCVDQEHALEMRRALVNLNSDLVRQYPDYVCRVTADEGDVGRGHLSRFQDVESRTPTILTTSQLLTTGVDAPTCKNVVIARVIGSMVEFKQIIGRGTRLRDDYGKFYFTIIDYTGSATQLFADPAFDGDPVDVTEELTDEDGVVTEEHTPDAREVIEDRPPYGPGPVVILDPPPHSPRPKFYFDGGSVEIEADLVYELDADGKQLRVIRLTDYTGEHVRTLYADASALQAAWSDPLGRGELLDALAQRNISVEGLAEALGQPEADSFDLLCHLAFNAPLRTRKERAERLRRERKDFFEQYGPEARAVLDDLLEKYAVYGTAQLALPDALKVPPVSQRGNVGEIMRLFGGGAALRAAVDQMQALLYAA